MSRRNGTLVLPDRPQIRLTARPDEIQTRAPLKAAAMQMQPGDGADLNYPASAWYFDTCPRTKRPKSNEEDYTGRVHGRMTVIGLLDKGGHFSGKWNASSWVVRCACGLYETRRPRVAREGKKDGGEDMCHRCRYIFHLGRAKKAKLKRRLCREEARNSYFQKHGRWPEADGFDTSGDDWVRKE